MRPSREFGHADLQTTPQAVLRTSQPLTAPRSLTGQFHLDALRGRFRKKDRPLPLRALMWMRNCGHRRRFHRLAHVVHVKTEVMQPWTVLREPFLQGMA